MLDGPDDERHMSSRILIVDDDNRIASMIATMLRHGGHTVETALDGEDGLSKAQTFDPDLIITDVKMEPMDGFAFVAQLRRSERTTAVPVIFLTALAGDDERIRGFQLGADDFLAKPFRFEELNLRVERTLRHVERVRTLTAEVKAYQANSVALNGNISQIGVGSLLTILEMDRKSGILVLSGSNGSGRVFLREGRVIAATLAKDATCLNADAIYVMLGWDDGTFELTAIDVDMDDQINLPTMELLLEGARRIDELRHGDAGPDHDSTTSIAHPIDDELAELLDDAPNQTKPSEMAPRSVDAADRSGSDDMGSTRNKH